MITYFAVDLIKIHFNIFQPIKIYFNSFTEVSLKKCLMPFLSKKIRLQKGAKLMIF